MQKRSGRMRATVLVVAVIGALVAAIPSQAAGELSCSNIPTSGRVSASAEIDYQIRLTWEPVANATGFRLFRDGAWYKELTSADTAYLNTLLIPGVSYQYEVFALCWNGPLSIGKASATAFGAPVAPMARSSYSFYIAEGDSIAGGSYIMPGANESLARRYSKQVTEFFLGEGGTERNEYAGGSECRDYSGNGSRYGLVERLGDKMTNTNWAQADLVTVGVGTHELRSGLVSADTFRECMRQVVQMISPTPERQLIRTLVFMGITPDISGEALKNGWQTYRRSWNKALREVAYHSRVPFIDVERKLDDAEAAAEAAGECARSSSIDPEVVPTCTALPMFDQVHPSWRGHDLMAEEVIDTLMSFMPSTFERQAFPGRPIPSDFRINSAPASGNVRYTWSPPAAPFASQMRPIDTYEVQYKLADTASWTSVLTSANYFDVPVSAGSASPYWVKVRAFSSSVAGPWSLYGHDARLAPTEWFERFPHWREADFLRDRSDIAVAWDPRDLPSADPDRNCDDGCAYIFGGRDSVGDQVSTEVFRFNPKTNRATFVTHMRKGTSLRKLWGASAVFSGRLIYVFGGYQDTGQSNVVFSFDPITGETKDTAVLPAEGAESVRAYTSSVFDPRTTSQCPEGCAYVFGGMKKTTTGTKSSYLYYSQIVRFDPKSNSVSVMPVSKLVGRDSKNGRCCTSAIWDNVAKRAIIFGGRVANATSDYVITDDVIAFDPVADSLSTISHLPMPMQYSTAVWDGSDAYVFGGDLDGTTYASDRIIKMNSSGQFTMLGQRLTSGRRLAGTICDGNSAYIFGGDWINGYKITHPYQVPPTQIRVSTTQILKFPSISQSQSGCDPAPMAYPPMITSPNEGSSSGNGQLRIAGRSEPGNTVRVIEGGIVVGQTTANTMGDWSVDILFPTGTHAVVATATDAAGRTSFASAARSFSVDNTPPDAPTISSPAQGESVLSRNVNIIGNAEAGSTVKVYEGSTLRVTGTTTATETFSVTTYLSLGSHSIHVVASDAVGNTSLTSATRTFEVTAPTAILTGSIESARYASGVAWDPRDRVGGGCSGGCAYLFGGIGPAGSAGLGGRLDHIYAYNPSTNVGKKLATKLPAPTFGVAAVSDGTSIWLFGGQPTDFSSSDKIYRFDPVTSALTEMRATLPVHGGVRTIAGRSFASAVWDPRDRPTSGCPGGCAYLFGGFHKEADQDRYVNQIVRYNPTLDVAVPVAAVLPGASVTSGRSSMSAAWDPSRGVAVLFGGQTSPTAFSDQILIFDPLTSSLTVSGAKLPQVRQMPSAIYDPTTATFLIAGGYSAAGQYSDEILRFDPASTVNVVGYLPAGMKGAAGVEMNGKILLLGGYNAAGPLASVLRFP